MPFIRKIENYDLIVNDKAVSFAVKTMQEIEAARTPGESEEPHRHNFYTIIWVEKAFGEHRIDLRTYPLGEHTLFFIHPEQIHQLRTEGKPEGLVILFTRDFLVRNGIREQFIHELGLFRESGSESFLKLAEPNTALNDLASQLRQSFLSTDAYREDVFSACLKLFLIACHRLKTALVPPETAEANYPETILKFKKLVELHYLELHKVSDYSKLLFISPNYLNEIIKKHTGRTAKEYIQNRLITEARRLAHFTDLSSKEIGFKLGFQDPSHFAKFWKKHNQDARLRFVR